MDKKLIITREWLQEQGACSEGFNWFISQRSKTLVVVIQKLISENKLDWASWTLLRFMNQREQIKYACYAAQLSLSNFEKVYPDDTRPKEAIEAALKWAKEPTEDNRVAAESAARSAESAESAARSAAWSAESAAWSAESAARSAARSAESAAWSAESAARSAAWSAESAARSAAWSAAWSAESAARSAESAALKDILLYGLGLVVGNKCK